MLSPLLKWRKEFLRALHEYDVSSPNKTASALESAIILSHVESPTPAERPEEIQQIVI